jgi:hypothetical protein
MTKFELVLQSLQKFRSKDAFLFLRTSRLWEKPDNIKKFRLWVSFGFLNLTRDPMTQLNLDPDKKHCYTATIVSKMMNFYHGTQSQTKLNSIPLCLRIRVKIFDILAQD